MNDTAKTKKPDETAGGEDIEKITAEIRRLRSDMSSLVDTVGKVGRSRARHLADTASGKADEGIAAGEAMLAEATTELQRIERDLETATRRNPLRALGIAAGVGFLLALFVRRCAVLRIAAILAPLALGRAREGLHTAQRKLLYLSLAAGLGLIALVFALVTVTVLIAAEIGVIWALAVMTAAAATACGGVLLALRAADARAARQRSTLSKVPPGVYVSSLSRLLAASGGGGRRRGLGLGLLGIGALLLLLLTGDDDGDA